jgi:hypothetical protein
LGAQCRRQQGQQQRAEEGQAVHRRMIARLH